MATKVFTTDLKVGMFVADLDRPWVDTPFLLQGFLIEDDDQIAALRTHCEYVVIDRARSTGDQFQAPSAAEIARKNAAAPPPQSPPRPAPPPEPRAIPNELPEVRVDKDGNPRQLLKLEDIARRGRRGGKADNGEGGGFGRMFSGLKGGELDADMQEKSDTASDETKRNT